MKKNNPLLNGNFLNIVPLICSLMVVMIHQHLVSGDVHTISSRIISFFTHGLCTAAVPTFFLLSGYLFFRNTDTLSAVFQKQRKRVKSVLMPFLAWSAFYYVLYAAVSIVIPGFLESNVSLSPLRILKGIIFYEFSFPLWYMFQLCVFVLLTPVLLLILKNKIAGIAVLTIATVFGFMGTELSVDVGGYQRSLFQVNFFAYYWLGCLLTRLPDVQDILVKLAKRLPSLVLVIAFVGAGILESLLFDELLPSFNSRIAVPLVFFSFLLLMVKLCQREKTYSSPKFSTMVIYGVHSAVGVFLVKFVLSRLGLPEILLFAVSFASVAVISAAVAWTMRYIKPIHWLFSGAR